LPAGAEEPIVTPTSSLAKIADTGWANEIAEGGSGVTFAEFVAVVKESLATFRLQHHVIEITRPTDNTPETLASVRQVLATNDARDENIVLVYYNQGVLTGDWDGPHISPIAAYDEESRQVLIMDVDREWYVPYWTSDTKLLDAMLRPAPRRTSAACRGDRRSGLDQAGFDAMSEDGFRGGDVRQTQMPDRKVIIAPTAATLGRRPGHAPTRR
jgi:Phytochelatin synthase